MFMSLCLHFSVKRTLYPRNMAIDIEVSAYDDIGTTLIVRYTGEKHAFPLISRPGRIDLHSVQDAEELANWW